MIDARLSKINYEEWYSWFLNYYAFRYIFKHNLIKQGSVMIIKNYIDVYKRIYNTFEY